MMFLSAFILPKISEKTFKSQSHMLRYAIFQPKIIQNNRGIKETHSHQCFYSNV